MTTWAVGDYPLMAERLMQRLSRNARSPVRRSEFRSTSRLTKHGLVRWPIDHGPYVIGDLLHHVGKSSHF